MNKLISKIVGVALGLTLAAGTGVAIATNSGSAFRADAASDTTQYSLINSTSDLEVGKSYIITNGTSGTVKAIGTATNSNNRKTTEVSVSNNKITRGSSVMSFELGGSSGAWTFATENYAGTNGYLASAASGNNNYLRVIAEAGTATIAFSGDEAVINIGPHSSRTQIRYNTSNLFACYASGQSAVYLWKEVAATSSPTIVVSGSMQAKIGTNTLSVSYSNFTANSAINAVSDDTSVATVTSSVTVPNTSGSVDFTVTGKVAGTANITLSATGAESVTVAVTVLNIQEFTKITKAGQVVSGGHYLIAKTGSNLAMSTTQNSNNRGTANATGSDPYTTLESASGVAVVTISAGTGDYANYYTMYDPANEGYLCAASGGNYLRTGATVSGNYYYWSITFSSGNAVITNKGNSYTIRNNGALISCYASGQTAVNLYLLTSELPADVALTSISASNTSVQEGSTVTFSGTYLPANATEEIEATLTDDTLATLGEVTMSNGTFSVSITAVSVGSTTLAFEGADGHGSASITLTVTAYSATHTKVTDSTGLYNGMKVILGNSTEGYVGAPHLGGNNLPAIAGSFSSSGDTLSNAAGTAQEFTLWYLTIADSNDNDVSGWAFYANGRYLTCATGTNNYWKQTYKLSSMCLFTISFSSGDASIVCADSNVVRNTLSLNTGSSIISAYESCSKVINLYVKQSSSDAAIAAGYEDFCLLMDYISTSNKGSGFCITDDYYLHAKNEYNNTLTNDQKSLLSANAVARLQAWAVANGDVLASNPGTIAQAANNGVMNLVDNNSALIIVVITAFVTTTFVAGYFFLHKKKEN